MGYSGLDRFNYEHQSFEKEENILGYIALKGCAWSTDIARNLLMDSEEVNKLLAKLIHNKAVAVVAPFERFTPPDIVMTREKDLKVETGNSLTPENWAKRSFFYLTDEGLDNWMARNKGKGLRAHNIYIGMHSLILKPLNANNEQQGQRLSERAEDKKPL